MNHSKVGYIVRSESKRGLTVLNHLKSNELYLISGICKDSRRGEVEVRATKYKDENSFITQKF